jgi:two-component system sensor histidine kinase GlrK
MQAMMTEVRDTRLSTIDAEEALHRAAWNIEVALRHGESACETDAANATPNPKIAAALDNFAGVYERTAPRAPARLRAAVERYRRLAEGANEHPGCAFLLARETGSERIALDEELTNAWIDRLHELHTEIDVLEDEARRMGTKTAALGVGVGFLALVAAALVARMTARSVAAPIALLAKEAMRLGEGDFSPLPHVEGPMEVEELRRDLERTRERLAELDQLKQQFIANVSHELRSPLGRVREALSLVADGTCGPLTAKQTRVLSLATRACEREVRIVDALLDMSRLRAGLPAKRESACDVDRVIAAAVEDEAMEAQEREVRVDVKSEGAAPMLDIDSALVERAVANLVRNAVSVSRKGQRVTVRRSLGTGSSGARSVCIEVVDEGPGMPEAVRAQAFRPFFAANVASAERPGGIGLGLAFAREVARAHQGELLLVESSERGTTMRLELPVSNPTARSAA